MNSMNVSHQERNKSGAGQRLLIKQGLRLTRQTKAQKAKAFEKSESFLCPGHHMCEESRRGRKQVAIRHKVFNVNKHNVEVPLCIAE